MKRMRRKGETGYECVCVCVCEREREREREDVSVCVLCLITRNLHTDKVGFIFWILTERERRERLQRTQAQQKYSKFSLFCFVFFPRMKKPTHARIPLLLQRIDFENVNGKKVDDKFFLFV